MNRLYIKSPDAAQKTVEGLYKDFERRIVASPPGQCPADLTIMEEGSEFLERLASRNRYKWPMYTSCCPGWVRFMKTQYPDMVDDLSTAKSPQQMFGAMSKTYIAQKLGLDPDKIFSISIMPCISKKY